MVMAPRFNGQPMPVGHGRTRAKKTSIATPMQISGTTMGSAMTPSSAVLPGKRKRQSNTADIAPRMTETMVQMNGDGERIDEGLHQASDRSWRVRTNRR